MNENFKVVADNGNGTQTVSVFSAPVRYIDEAGNWQDINNTIYLNTLADPVVYKYATQANAFTIGFKETPNDAEFIRFVFARGTRGSLSLTLNGLYYLDANTGQRAFIATPSAAVGLVSGDKITYTDAFPGVALEFTVLNDRLKDNVILGEAFKTWAPSPAAYGLDPATSFVVLSYTLNSKHGEQNMEKLAFLGSDGLEYIWAEPITAQDANGEDLAPFEQYDPVAKEFTFGISYTTTQTAVYPLEIDPTLTVATGVHDGFMRRKISDGTYSRYTSQSTDKIGTDGYYNFRHYCRFDITAYATQTVYNAQYRYYPTASGTLDWNLDQIPDFETLDATAAEWNVVETHTYPTISQTINAFQYVNIQLAHAKGGWTAFRTKGDPEPTITSSGKTNGTVAAYGNATGRPAIIFDAYDTFTQDAPSIGGGEVTVNWTNGGGLVSGDKHRIYYKAGTGLTAADVKTGSCVETTSYTAAFHTVSGLTDGVNYCFVIVDLQQVNGTFYEGATSNVASATPEVSVLIGLAYADAKRAVKAQQAAQGDTRRRTQQNNTAQGDTQRKAQATGTAPADVHRKVSKAAMAINDTYRKALANAQTATDTVRKVGKAAGPIFDTFRKLRSTATAPADTRRKIQSNEQAQADTRRGLKKLTQAVSDTFRKTRSQAVATSDTVRKALNNALAAVDTGRRVRVLAQLTGDIYRKAQVNAQAVADTFRKTLAQAVTQVDTMREVIFVVTQIIAADTRRIVKAAGSATGDTYRKLKALAQAQADTQRKNLANAIATSDSYRKVAAITGTLVDTYRKTQASTTVMLETNRMLQYIVTLTADTKRRLFNSAQAVGDTYRKTLKAAVAQADTSRRLAALITAVADTVRNIQLVTSAVVQADTYRKVIKNVAAPVDLKRRTLANAVVNSDTYRKAQNNVVALADAYRRTQANAVAQADTYRKTLAQAVVQSDAYRKVQATVTALADTYRKTSLNDIAQATLDTVRRIKAQVSTQADTVRKARINLAIVTDTKRRLGVKAVALNDTYRRALKAALAQSDTYRKTRKLATALSDSKRRLVVNIVALGDTLRKATATASAQADTYRKALVNTVASSDTKRKLAALISVQADTRRFVQYMNSGVLFLDTLRVVIRKLLKRAPDYECTELGERYEAQEIEDRYGAAELAENYEVKEDGTEMKTFTLGEEKEVGVEITSTDGTAFIVAAATYEYKDGGTTLASGGCSVDGGKVYVLLRPTTAGYSQKVVFTVTLQPLGIGGIADLSKNKETVKAIVALTVNE